MRALTGVCLLCWLLTWQGLAGVQDSTLVQEKGTYRVDVRLVQVDAQVINKKTHQVAGSLSGGRIDPDRRQSLQMIVTLVRVDYVDRLIAAREAVLDERKQDAIFFLVAVEKRADVTRFAQLGAGKGNRC